MDAEFFSIKELAVVFAVNEMTIRRAIKKGYIAAMRIGPGKRSPYRISKKTLEAMHNSALMHYLKKPF